MRGIIPTRGEPGMRETVQKYHIYRLQNAAKNTRIGYCYEPRNVIEKLDFTGVIRVKYTLSDTKKIYCVAKGINIFFLDKSGPLVMNGVANLVS